MIEERRDDRSFDGPVEKQLLREPAEIQLNEALDQFRFIILEPDFASEAFQGVMSNFASLRQPVDEFFDKVTVNTDDPRLRENRLRLLSRIRAVMNQVADFSQIEG